MSLKPLVRWATFQGWTLRYTGRGEETATGVFTTPEGMVPFRYERAVRTIHLPGRAVRLNEHGWEVDESGETHFRFPSGGEG